MLTMICQQEPAAYISDKFYINISDGYSLMHGKLASSFARNWSAKKYASRWNTRHQGAAKNSAVFTWVKVCIFKLLLKNCYIYCI